MTFSDAILLMDVSPLWAILFFFMLILLGIDSEFGTLEAAIGPIMEEDFPQHEEGTSYTSSCSDFIPVWFVHGFWTWFLHFPNV